MGVYGIDFYGVGRFGPDPAVVRPDFSVDPFTTTPLDYSTLHLMWQKPHSTDCVYLRLVRKTFNLSQDGGQPPLATDDANAQADGTVIFTCVVDQLLAYTDTPLGSGFYYYTMWGWSQTNQIWVRCSDVIGLVPINWGYGYRLYNLIPMAYRDRDIVLVDPYNPWPVESATPPLQRYLQLIGFQLDFIRTELESLMSVNDAMNCSGALLPLMANQFALPHEPEIGMQQERQMCQNAVHLYKLKGSPRGITEFCTLMTSYPSTGLFHHGYNCLLTLDDSAFFDAIGTWQAWPPPGTLFPPITGQSTNIGFLWISDMTQAPYNLPSPLNALYPNYSPGPPYYQNSGMRLQAIAAGDITVTTSPIPITDFMSQTYAAGNVTFRISIYSPVARAVYLSVWGDVGSGVPQQIIAPTAVTPTANTWTTMTVTGTITPYPQSVVGASAPTGPASFYWIYPRIRIAGALANEVHYVTLMGLWPCKPAQIGVDTPPFDYARDVKVVLSPQSANLLSNTVTTFTRTNPNPPPAQLNIGFDGLTAAANPMAPTGAATGNMVIHYQSIEDGPGTIAVNGTAALEMDVNAPNGTIWWGKVQTWSSTTTWASPYGWFVPKPPAANADWFAGAVPGSAEVRPWFDPDMNQENSWFFVPEPNTQPPNPGPPYGNYFGIGSDIVNGLWFPNPPQPPQNGNLTEFTVQAGQPFNFSVYARYVTVADPTNAVMQMGFRWYYPDGTWVEVSQNVILTGTYQRYAIAPANGPYYLADPPPEPTTGVMPTGVFPFVRFTAAQQAVFLLNSAMLSPTETEPAYMDATSYSSATGNFLQDTSGASYMYYRRTPRIARLNAELYRWLPMGSTYSIVYTSGAIMPPLDPTLWP